MSTSPHVVDVDLRNFEQVVLLGSQQTPVLVDFWATWCEPCKTLGPLLERLAEEYAGAFVLAKIDIDRTPQIAEAFRVQSVPTVVLIANGQPVDAFAGGRAYPELKAFLEPHLGEASGAAGDPVAEARELLREIVGRETELQRLRGKMSLGYTGPDGEFVPASSVALGNNVRTHPDAAIREAIASMDGAKDGLEDDAASTVVPKVAHAEGAAELVVVDGDPDWRPVPGTNLLQLQDSTSDVFLNTTDGRYYLLSSGRWFGAASPDAAWSLVAPDAVPAEFRRIPANDAEAGPVLASVPGTIESRQAIARAQVPEIAAIERDDASLVVVYDGSPRFDRIDGTSMQYAVNADLPVIRVKGRCYAVKDAVWFTSPRPTGPWTDVTIIARPLRPTCILPNNQTEHTYCTCHLSCTSAPRLR